MENASRALVMAGSVLIALMIIGALLLMFNNLSSYQNTGAESTRESQIVEFNQQYETYNRPNVKGIELYSLLNQAVDYNKRKSIEGTGSNEGQYLAYQPITINFSLTEGGGRSKFSQDGTSRLLKRDKYEQSSIKNEFDGEISETVKDLENKYGKDSITNLTTSLTKIFIDSNDARAKQDAVGTFNKISKKIQAASWDDLKEDKMIRNEVYTYYEYVQFKRARFDCYNVEYNSKTGRVVKMEFRFTGKFQ